MSDLRGIRLNRGERRGSSRVRYLHTIVRGQSAPVVDFVAVVGVLDPLPSRLRSR